MQSLRDEFDCIVGELGKHRQRKLLVRDSLGVWELALSIPESGECVLQMAWNWVMDVSFNAALAQSFCDAVAVTHEDGINVIDVFDVGGDLRASDLRQEPIVGARRSPTLVRPSLKVAQLHA